MFVSSLYEELRVLPTVLKNDGLLFGGGEVIFPLQSHLIPSQEEGVLPVNHSFMQCYIVITV